MPLNNPGARPTPAVLGTRLEELITRVYLAVLRQEHATRTLLVAQGMSGETVDQALQVLTERGLVVHRGDGVWFPVAPDIALPAFATDLERQARAARSAAHELAQVFYETHAAARVSDDRVQVLRSLDDLHRATADIVATATSRVRTLRGLSARTRHMFAAPLASHREKGYSADGHQLTFEGTYAVDVLDLPNAREVLRARAEGGEAARFVPRAPFSAVVVDDTAAVLDLSAYDETGSGSLLLRSPPLVQAIAATVDEAWRLGSPIVRDQSEAPVDDRDAQILSLLAAGSSDATIARQSGVSQRTIERRLRVLMDRLGARTRFQAGREAGRRGWV